MTLLVRFSLNLCYVALLLRFLKVATGFRWMRLRILSTLTRLKILVWVASPRRTLALALTTRSCLLVGHYNWLVLRNLVGLLLNSNKKI